MLTKINEKGQTFSVKRTPTQEHKKALQKLSTQEQLNIDNYVQTVINVKKNFSIATAFSNPWPDELTPLYTASGSELQAAYNLSYIIMDKLIDTDEDWFCTKTDITKRDLETNFYFKR